ncbi:MAG TPA: transglycosylase SLT domain-containing protein [Lamprocystis sp. (in: g-proteobacteria)]|nr:transglycosylase SLT domain-containing protein [Lamprocystis sp. (in: g-proteobacteria)]
MRHGLRTPLPCRLLIACLLAGPVLVSAADATFIKAYASGSKGQLTEWGRRFEHGEGIPKNLDNAIRLYCKAAAKGDTNAQYYLGWLYANGNGVRRDEELAAAWLHLAAAQNDQQSKRILALLGFSKKPRRQPSCALTDGRDARRPAPSPLRIVSLGPSRSQSATGPIADLVRDLAVDYQLDPNLVLALIEAESNFNPQARSPKNAQGLMQLIPATAERFGVRNVWDPEQNLRGGMAYLRWLLGYFKGDLRLALAGYNAGEGAVDRHGGVPPFPETQAYVSRIMGKIAP